MVSGRCLRAVVGRRSLLHLEGRRAAVLRLCSHVFGFPSLDIRGMIVFDCARIVLQCSALLVGYHCVSEGCWKGSCGVRGEAVHDDWKGQERGRSSRNISIKTLRRLVNRPRLQYCAAMALHRSHLVSNTVSVLRESRDSMSMEAR